MWRNFYVWDNISIYERRCAIPQQESVNQVLKCLTFFKTLT